MSSQEVADFLKQISDAEKCDLAADALLKLGALVDRSWEAVLQALAKGNESLLKDAKGGLYIVRGTILNRIASLFNELRKNALEGLASSLETETLEKGEKETASEEGEGEEESAGKKKRLHAKVCEDVKALLGFCWHLSAVASSCFWYAERDSLSEHLKKLARINALKSETDLLEWSKGQPALKNGSSNPAEDFVKLWISEERVHKLEKLASLSGESQHRISSVMSRAWLSRDKATMMVPHYVELIKHLPFQCNELPLMYLDDAEILVFERAVTFHDEACKAFEDAQKLGDRSAGTIRDEASKTTSITKGIKYYLMSDTIERAGNKVLSTYGDWKIAKKLYEEASSNYLRGHKELKELGGGHDKQAEQCKTHGRNCAALAGYCEAQMQRTILMNLLGEESNATETQIREAFSNMITLLNSAKDGVAIPQYSRIIMQDLTALQAVLKEFEKAPKDSQKCISLLKTLENLKVTQETQQTKLLIEQAQQKDDTDEKMEKSSDAFRCIMLLDAKDNNIKELHAQITEQALQSSLIDLKKAIGESLEGEAKQGVKSALMFFGLFFAQDMENRVHQSLLKLDKPEAGKFLKNHNDALLSLYKAESEIHDFISTISVRRFKETTATLFEKSEERIKKLQSLKELLSLPELSDIVEPLNGNAKMRVKCCDARVKLVQEVPDGEMEKRKRAYEAALHEAQGDEAWAFATQDSAFAEAAEIRSIRREILETSMALRDKSQLAQDCFRKAGTIYTQLGLNDEAKRCAGIINAIQETIDKTLTNIDKTKEKVPY